MLQLIGQGSSSQVYLAEHMKLKQIRAIKRISKNISPQHQFFLEAELLKSFNHPGIPVIYDLEEDENYDYLIEEYIQGESLEAVLLRQKEIPIELFYEIAKQLCDILSYLHSQPDPVIYQDLKPEHILIRHMKIWLIDYGISVTEKGSGNRFQSYGTRDYVAPEKLQGISCDIRTDIYGVGAVLNSMLPYLKQSDHHLTFILQKAMAEKKEQRYGSIEELKEALLFRQQECTSVQIPTNQKHLVKNIAIAGVKPGIGVTHIAASMTCYLNYTGHKAEYVRERFCRDTEGQLTDRGRESAFADFHTEYFQEERWSGPCNGNQVNHTQKEYRIRDFGVCTSMNVELEECDGILLIAGSRIWEQQNTNLVYQHFCQHSQLAFIVNHQDIPGARIMSRQYRRKVYCYPLEEDPFLITGEKQNFFQQLLKQEGW